jgi:hypothetical protein
MRIAPKPCKRGLDDLMMTVKKMEAGAPIFMLVRRLL